MLELLMFQPRQWISAIAAWLHADAGEGRNVVPKALLLVLVAAVALGGGYFAWRTLTASDVPPGLVGRLEKP